MYKIRLRDIENDLQVGDVLVGRVESYHPQMQALFISVDDARSRLIVVDLPASAHTHQLPRQNTVVALQVTRLVAPPKHHKGRSLLQFSHHHCHLRVDGLQLASPIHALVVEGDNLLAKHVKKRCISKGIRGGYMRVTCQLRNNQSMQSVIEQELDELVDAIAELSRTLRCSVNKKIDFFSDDGAPLKVETCAFGQGVGAVAGRRRRRKSPASTNKHSSDQKLSVLRALEEQQESLPRIKQRIALTCGGELVVEQTEAMLVIDVNRRLAKISDHEINLQAARMIGRLLDDQNYRGLGVIDFIGSVADDEMYQLKREIILKKDLSATFTFETALSLGVALFARGISHS